MSRVCCRASPNVGGRTSLNVAIKGVIGWSVIPVKKDHYPEAEVYV